MPTDPRGLEEEHPELAARNARAGLVLFFLYLALYAGFVALNAFAPEIMAQSSPIGGVKTTAIINGAAVNTYDGLTWSLVYGIGLILVAFALAMVYVARCRWNARHPKRSAISA